MAYPLLRFLAPLAIALAVNAHAGTGPSGRSMKLTLDADGYLGVDGQWYLIPSGTQIEYFPDSLALAVTATSAIGCHRGDGLPYSIGSQTLFYGQTLQVVPLAGALTISPSDPMRIALTTPMGNTVCSGSVAPPDVPAADTLFRNGFE